MINYWIVDDEASARYNLRDALAERPGWQLTGEFSSAQGVIATAQQQSPDVVFLDIRMPGQDGIALASELNRLNSAPLIAFVTAYDRFALEAFELFAIDYVLKPFDDERLLKTVARIEQCCNEPSLSAQHRRHQRAYINQDYLKQLVIRSAGSIRFIDISDIHWLSASGNYVEVHSAQGLQVQRVSLVRLEQYLNPKQFCRCHRSAIVNVAMVQEIRSLENEKYQIVLKTGERVPLSLTFRDALLQHLGICP